MKFLKRNMMTFKEIHTFGKFSISIPVAFTSYAGYVLFDEQLSFAGILVAVGIFFLSAGASAINQLQEIRLDAKMPRTENRPLPNGRLSIRNAILIVALFAIAGTVSLSFFGWRAVLWGWIGLFWYNLVYTPMKTRSAFSVFPGAIVGAIPPVAGWVAAGGSIIDPRVHFLAFFFFLGQMPHFWLLVIKYKDQYKQAGFPVITDVLSIKQVMRINLIWFIATFISALFIPAVQLLDQNFTIWILTASSISMIVWTIKTNSLFQNDTSNHLKKMFLYFNSFYLWVMILIFIDKI